MPTPPTRERALQEARRALRVRGYSRRTEDTYTGWIDRFLRQCAGRSLEHLQRCDVIDFLAYLTERSRLAPKTRNQATAALAFFFREVVGRDVLRGMPRAREARRVPTVLSHRQVTLVLGALSGKYRLIASLMYGAGLRVSEAHQLRVKDIDFDLRQITVRDGKGGKDRWAMLPESVVAALRRQIERVRAVHEEDRRSGGGWAPLPHALAQKDTSAAVQLAWQYLFPASRMSRDPHTGRTGRHHLNPTATQRAVKKAGRSAGLPKPVSCHTLRRSFATQLLRAGYDVRTVQRLMGHKDVRTTMIYVEAVSDSGVVMRSPLDQPNAP